MVKGLWHSIAADTWKGSTPFFTLADEEIHIWIVDRRISIPYEYLISTLKIHERMKASYFTFGPSYDNFIKTRFFIKLASALYLNLGIQEVEFTYNPYQKPLIHPLINHNSLYFNISHSNELILFAFIKGSPIGVDIEYINNETVCELGEDPNILTLHEIEMLRTCPPRIKSRLFYKIWTCKEAFVKAIGVGLHVPMNKIILRPEENEVTLDHVLYKDRILNEINVPIPHNKYTITPLRFLPDRYIGTISHCQKNIRYIKYVNMHTIKKLVESYVASLK